MRTLCTVGGGEVCGGGGGGGKGVVAVSATSLTVTANDPSSNRPTADHRSVTTSSRANHRLGIAPTK